MNNIKIKYTKSPKTIEEQIELLKKRGLIIDNEDKIKYFLTNISYYHWSIYFKHFQENDKFLKNTNFKDILRIYKFDNKLRLLILEILERIEKSFKCRIAYELSIHSNNSHCYMDDGLYIDKNKYKKIIAMIKKEVDNSKKSEISIKHYLNKYSKPKLPPIWSIIEILSFGQCSKMFGFLSRDNKNKIARTLGEDQIFIFNWMYILSYLRNKCAHHSRLWNFEFIFVPKMNHKKYKEFFNHKRKKRIFNYLVVLLIVMKKINPTSDWLTRLKKLISEYKINVSHMGFPDDWENRLDVLDK